MSDNLPPQGPGRRTAALATGGLLLAAALVSCATDGDESALLDGAQPSQALPAATLAYAAVDLDPSGKQKIEAIRTLQRFPGFTDEVDVEEDDDVRARIFDLAQEDSGECTDLDFEQDIDSWLGERFAVAAVEGGAEPFPVGVLQVEGEDATREGLDKLAECSSDNPEDYGLAFVDDEWAVVAETQEQADQVLADVEDGTLRDDDEFQKWTKETGDAGIVHLYAAPELGAVLLDHVGEIFGMADDLSGEGLPGGANAPRSEEEVPDGVREALENFAGAAGTLRFADGAIEAEFVTATDSGQADVAASAAGAEAVASLPATTAAAFGFGLDEGWLDVVIEQMEPLFQEELGMSSDDALAELEKHTGLTKDDIEALGGESVAVAVDASIDPATFQSSPDPAELPIGLKIKGDTDEIEAALDKLREAGGPEASRHLLSESTGDHVVIAMNEDYLGTLAGEDGLGDDDVYQDVVGDDSPAAVLFVSFDAGDNWLDTLVTDLGAPEEVRENLEPLSGLGMSAWLDGDVAHTLVKLTTD